ncbi:MAG: DUF1566 domain-containing protein [Bacteroidales bacterium]|nr:DUF1566 domain-containing protein [Bacteroidales bacterium]
MKALQTEVKTLKSELEKTRKALAEALEQIEKLKKKESGKPASQPKEEAMKDGHEYVDLGLPSGLKWATCNIGARVPEASGDYFAWGEIKTKRTFSESGSLTYGKKKYSIEISGDSQLDAARANWGGSWRMPTKYECQELIDKCKWEYVTINGVNGYKVTGTNGNSIFLPAAGFRYVSSLYRAGNDGYYWSSTPSESDANGAYYISFGSSGYEVFCIDRNYGRCIRPVSE